MKKCPRCKINKHSHEWAKGGYTNTTYCIICMREVNRQKKTKAKDIILKHTNNGKCWWVYQSILADISFRKD
jgi:hypothetical protein